MNLKMEHMNSLFGNYQTVAPEWVLQARAKHGNFITYLEMGRGRRLHCQYCRARLITIH